jgi:hypothetical protein
MTSYDEWISAVFDHPAEGPEWFWDPEFDSFWNSLELSDSQLVEFLTRLFSAPAPLQRYSLPQVGQGIWFLVGDSSPASIAHTLVQTDVALSERITCLNVVPEFFRQFVVPNAPGPANENTDAFHTACYMWWDIFPSWGGPKAGEPAIHNACLEAMAEILQLPSELCQLSALHGLNHWRLHHAERVHRIVDTFLRGDRLTPRIRDYAAAARNGLCL